jgi:anti-sigma-K factor RskA
MNKRSFQKIEKVLDEKDGEPRGSGLSGEETALLGDLARMRAAARALDEASPRIEDAQFPSFMAGVREAIEQPQRGNYRGFWAFASLATAALVVAVSAFVVFSGEPPAATASVVEQATTEIRGAVVHWQHSEEGDTTVWLDVADSDIW